MLKAIETEYHGYRFRSRLEARWAVFFDVLDWGWEYEKEGFKFPDRDGNEIWYLPDFFIAPRPCSIPGEGAEPRGVWVEVKPNLEAVGKLEFDKLVGLAASTRIPVILVVGVPTWENSQAALFEHVHAKGGCRVETSNIILTPCPSCGGPLTINTGHEAFTPELGRLALRNNKMVEACMTARQARFGT